MVSIQDTTIPRSKPLKSFKDLLAWQPGQDEYNVAHTPLHPRPELLRRGVRYHRHGSDKPVPETSPETHDSGLEGCKVIVCHDMAGGYAEDVWPQGNDYNTIYSIQYWNYIDTFIYFSHYRITIPPPVWTNAAHKNGVRCLGTIITEWLEGVLETDEMVSGPGQEFVNEDGDDVVDRRWFSRTYADKLVDMAVYYKFDGWFINIESILRGGAKQANQTIAFLAYLRAQIHARIPGGELVWYDSVVSSTGEVNWQDRLTPENYQFFEQSDGIFTNYTWKEQFVGESVALAGPRNRDVYTGIDIWGRNTFGGGGFSTYRALEVIQREKTSCALFAPAWTYESLGKEKFMRNDRRFWIGSLGAGKHFEGRPPSSSPDQASRLLSGEQWANPAGGNKDGKDGEVDRKQQPEFLPVSAYIPARPSGTSSWFYSNFDRGFGTGFWVNGKSLTSHGRICHISPCRHR
ncbi:glycosyl hydrolase family 85-domain-containing protein [Gamsiella multidivaricata]|uniref:glycosyl hydrolase family 85-domain-containing protein n=1 Tax=Gamsiella multidivaricata TaxID=101098 RepID=UPI00221E914B|nr:glycosyl hydrolase family 85-domain-containing protein [Gamsiella multidivaricata]KAI7828097.1 glycosyl hydrolase family 85-domain-containing protein [Gamsiella multidivaricata]